ncbi:hypothetical protein LTR78_004790 [Recurvomyces mirabilis]|uniref:F-box domain-containing protein n=1 Tax=Recurvomyces mirabilis TaxID=574656 RepID=A0AAE0WPB4_9PEZI|nr:hypothetical protein LTR78_004790 [Recurvomyces mirabilis]KAK5157961.1 hypothetical protein LTS14_003884 [Recurvomyces mirabilis]
MEATTLMPALVNLPAELILHIFIFLEPIQLAAVNRTCRALSHHSHDDQLWQPFVNESLPNPVSTPAPLKSFRELYIAHHPYWFLPKYRLWFGDTEHQGKLVAARYNEQKGCIEAYTVVAQRGRHRLEVWEKDREVIIHSFNPKIMLDLAKPVLKLDIGGSRTHDQLFNDLSDRAYAPPSPYSKEIVMDTAAEAGLFSSFMLCRKLPETAVTSQTAVWPPLSLPAPSHVRNHSNDGYQSAGHRPSRLEEVSEHHWRLRKWVEFNGRRANPTIVSLMSHGMYNPMNGSNGSYNGGGISIKMPEDITTFATLPEWAFTPTPAKPWQGLWCGDYSGHGCEFLVVLQPDKKDELPLPPGMDWLRQWFRGVTRRESSGSDASYASAQEEFDHEEAAREQMARMQRDAERNQQELIQAVTQQQLMQLLAMHNEDTQQPNIAPQILEGFTEPPVESPTVVASSSKVIPEVENQDVPSGRLEAIKLTGDPNIPRGELTFLAPDIGEAGFLRIADEEIFKGARIVRSAGHIAGRNFRDDQYTPSQLIMISHDRLAQFWEGFGHISYYQRVDVDALMKYTGEPSPPRQRRKDGTYDE